jgi:ADP-ribosylglycohydrolase
MLSSTHAARYQRALVALEGLSVGDAFGEGFFGNTALAIRRIAERSLPAPVWGYTDDTIMALGVLETLRQHQQIDQDYLAQTFARNYWIDPQRGYGASMRRLLQDIRHGGHWRPLARKQFSGQGSYGNGAAMRVAPLGAYFADDVALAVEQARLSSLITHTHEEAVAGAIAVAVAAAHAAQIGETGRQPSPAEFLDDILPYLPDTEVRSKICQARDFDPNASLVFAVSVLGSGKDISAQDTVPFALWCAARHLDNYEEALWLTVGGLGDRDTTCAIAGGIVAHSSGLSSIPATWRHSREPLPSNG